MNGGWSHIHRKELKVEIDWYLQKGSEKDDEQYIDFTKRRKKSDKKDEIQFKL